MLNEEELNGLLMTMQAERLDIEKQHPNEDIPKLFEQLIEMAEDAYEFIAIAEHLYDTNPERAREVFQKAVQIGKPDDLAFIASSVYSILNDKAWARSLLYEAERTSTDVESLLDVADMVSRDFHNTIWTQRIAAKAIKLSKTFDDYDSCFLHHTRYFENPKIAKAMFKKLRRKAKTTEELTKVSDYYLEHYSDIENSFKYAKKAMKKALKSLSFSEISYILNRVINYKSYHNIDFTNLNEIIFEAHNRIENNSDRCFFLSALNGLYKDKIDILVSNIYSFNEADDMTIRYVLAGNDHLAPGEENKSIFINDKEWYDNLLNENYTAISGTKKEKALLEIFRKLLIHYEDYIA